MSILVFLLSFFFCFSFFFFSAPAPTEIYTLSLHDALPILDRTQAYVEAGADAIFAEAMTDVSMYGEIVDLVGVPVLANLTEFGATPLYSVDELRRVGVHMALYPLSAFRAMSLAALSVYEEIRSKGTQREVVAAMQTRDQLYETLGYHAFEQKLDELFSGGTDDGGQET